MVGEMIIVAFVILALGIAGMLKTANSPLGKALLDNVLLGKKK